VIQQYKPRKPSSTNTLSAISICAGVFIGILITAVLSTGPAIAQDIFIYPAKGQSQAQQDKDRYECHT